MSEVLSNVYLISSLVDLRSTAHEPHNDRNDDPNPQSAWLAIDWEPAPGCRTSTREAAFR